MNGFAVLFTIIAAAGMLGLPRRWVVLPLLAGACYISPAQNVLLGPFHFTVLRLLLLIGVMRALVRREHLPGGLIGLDWAMVAWAAVMLCTTVAHEPFSDALVYRLGLAYNTLGMYFLVRIHCRTMEELKHILQMIGLLLVPIALEMVNEKLTGRNLFAVLGGIPDRVEVRDGKLRANGPFGHAILAGTVGALCAPLMIGIWRAHPRSAKVGLAACSTMVVASTSSGPLMTMVLGAFGLLLWRRRHLMRQLRLAAVLAYVLLDIVMKDPAYFLMARIDLTGSSTGWYRAQLIRSALAHSSEWLLAGTDRTRHWMATGLIIEEQADIVNHYLAQGVTGGLLLMAVFISWYWLAFRYVGRYLQLRVHAPISDQFLMWCLGSSLFASAVTCLSVSYFDQSAVFLNINLAVIGSLYATDLTEAVEAVPLAKALPLDARDSNPESIGNLLGKNVRTMPTV